jgi:hypothetical protein
VTGDFPVDVANGAGTGGFPDARPGMAAFADLRTAALDGVMMKQSMHGLDRRDF